MASSQRMAAAAAMVGMCLLLCWHAEAIDSLRLRLEHRMFQDAVVTGCKAALKKTGAAVHFKNPNNQARSLKSNYKEMLDDFRRQMSAGQYSKNSAVDVDVTVVQQEFIDQVGLFVDRVHAKWDDIVTAFTIPNTDQVTKISVASNDPHHHGRRVILFTLKSGKRLVYKPASLDANKWCCSSNADSFIKTYNGWVGTDDKKLHTYPVLSYQDATNGDWGILDFITYDGNLGTDTEMLNHYSYSFGQLWAIQVLLKMTDMHIENMMAHKLPSGKIQPVVIDAETMFTPFVNQEFGPDDTYACKTRDKGSLCNWQCAPQLDAKGKPKKDDATCKDVDKNSVISFNGQNFYPANPEKVRQGFQEALTLLRSKKADVQTWLTTTLPSSAVMRYVPTGTNSLRSLVWNANAQAKQWNNGAFCKQLTAVLGAALGWDPDVVDTKFMYMGMMRDNCKLFYEKFVDTQDVPGFFIKMDQKKGFFPDLTTEVSLDGVPLDNVATTCGTDDGCKTLRDKITAWDPKTNTELYPKTILELATDHANWFLADVTPARVTDDLTKTLSAVDTQFRAVNGLPPAAQAPLAQVLDTSEDSTTDSEDGEESELPAVLGPKMIGIDEYDDVAPTSTTAPDATDAPAATTAPDGTEAPTDAPTATTAPVGDTQGSFAKLVEQQVGEKQ